MTPGDAVGPPSLGYSINECWVLEVGDWDGDLGPAVRSPGYNLLLLPVACDPKTTASQPLRLKWQHCPACGVTVDCQLSAQLQLKVFCKLRGVPMLSAALYREAA